MAYEGIPVVQVVAAALNGVIGREGAMPWHLPADLKHFRTRTLDRPVIMGGRTHESIGRALPGRFNIVITRGARTLSEGVHPVPSLGDGLALAARAIERNWDGAATREIAVIGGAQIYELALLWTDRIYLTRILTEIEGDTVYPVLDPASWEEHPGVPLPDDKRATHKTRSIILERVAPS